MRTQTVRVHSCVDNRILTHVTVVQAREMCGENFDGSDMLGSDGHPIKPIARRLNRLKDKAGLTDIRLLEPARNESHSSRCTITCSETQRNAFAHEGAILDPREKMSAYDQATDKVAAWPEVHDDKAVTVSAGKVYGAVVCDQIPEQHVSFA